MKKTIEIPVHNSPDMAERRVEGIAKAIAKRLNIQAPESDKVVVDESSAKVEMSLTKEQIDALPVGLKKFVE